MKSAVVLAALSLLPSASLQAQVARPDSARRDTLEAVVVRATRAGTAAPTSRTTLDRTEIERRNAGQDAPLALTTLTGVTTASDAGGYSGYSSLRLRGIDQTRLSISVDGVPLNDPEDQVLYFSNVPDFMNSMQSVTVQRGVGASAFGTAPFAGSLNFESVPIATAREANELQLTLGDWGTKRASLERTTGLHRGFAGYGRVSAQETSGYRMHSGNRAHSGFLSAGWFGARDAVKFTGFAGRSRMQLAYYAASEDEIALNRRTNPMSGAERDDFHQEMASLQWTRSLTERARLTTTVYRNGAGGAYAVNVAPELWNFGLHHNWVGVLSTLTWERPGLAIATGAHVSTYRRDHSLKYDAADPGYVYFNSGRKQEQSAFGKVTLTRGPVDWQADLQLRRAAFQYEPTAGTPIGEPAIDWLFVNPKLGVTWRATPIVELFASAGQSSREPARTDLFAGADDLDSATAAEVLPMDRVRPERLLDIEAGARLTRARGTFTVNLFAMRFRDEIAPIGQVAITGSPLRKNVPRSSRIGIEAEGAMRVNYKWSVSGNAMVMRARIAEYQDEANAITYRDVPPLLSPGLVVNGQLTRHQGDGEVVLGLRHVGRSYLANDGNKDLTIPDFTMVDLGVGIPFLGTMIRVQVQNLLDTKASAGGYTDGTTRYLFPIATRTLLATAIIGF